MMDFRALVAVLQAHPDVWVARAQFLPGAEAADFERAEAQLGASLHPDIKAFYAAHNGLAIEWIFKHSPAYQEGGLEVDTDELPFWMDLMSDYGHPFDGQVIVAPIGEVFVDGYDSVEEPSEMEPEIAYVEYFRDPPAPSSGPFLLGERSFASEADFRSRLRIFDHFLRDYGNLMLWEAGQSDPDLFHLEDDWHNFRADRVLPLSHYLRHLAYDFGLRWQRGGYFKEGDLPPADFDPAERLQALVDASR